MKHTQINSVASVLLLTTVFLTACSGLPTQITLPTQWIYQEPTSIPEDEEAPAPVGADELLTKSQAAMMSIQSFGFEMETSIETGGIQINAKGQGVYQAPDQMYIQLSTFGQNIEILLSGESTIFVKLPGTATWTQLTPDLAAQMGGNLDLRSQIRVADLATSANLLGEETVDGVECYTIEFKLDAGKFIQTNPMIPSIFDPNNTDGWGKVWIGKSDSLIHKMVIELTMGGQGDPIGLRTEVNFNSYNQPVVIPSPS